MLLQLRLMNRRTKIVATLGPASSEEKIIHQLIVAGVNVFRMNFSHGSHEQFSKAIDIIRKIATDLDTPISLLQDLQGPKIRVGELKGGAVRLQAGKEVSLTSMPVTGDENLIPVVFPKLYESVQVNSRILLNDGNLELLVTGISDNHIKTRVMVGGVLKPHQGVNFPGANLRLSSPTAKDLEDLKFGLINDVDAIALSFVHSAEDVINLRKRISEIAKDKDDTPIIAKLERPHALTNLEEIVGVADGVMVARGDLGIEMSPEAVPIAQKKIIASANTHGKLVITATQMLESMIHNPRPTRAESTDVANAIFDGTDAVMLSGETAVGDYPVKAVETMVRIIQEAENHLSEWGHWQGELSDQAIGKENSGKATHDDALSITRAAKELAHDRNVAAIAVFTQTGRTASLISKSRPRVPIFAFTPIQRTYRRLTMLWGVIPYLVPYVNTVEAMLSNVERVMLETSTVKPGQQIVLVSGFPVGTFRPPNLALLYTIKENRR